MTVLLDLGLIALSGLMVSIVAIIIGVAIPEVRCFFGLQSESCPSPQPTPTPPSEPPREPTTFQDKANEDRESQAIDKWSRIQLFLHYFSPVGRTELERLNSFLVQQGLKPAILVNASELGANPPTNAEIRYYWKVDLPAARELINLISQRQIPISSEPVLVPEKYRYPSDEPGKIELWLTN